MSEVCVWGGREREREREREGRQVRGSECEMDSRGIKDETELGWE